MEISLNGTDVQMEVDTGASVSLISEETCITKVKDKLLTYPGNELPYWVPSMLKFNTEVKRTPCPFMSQRERTNLC